MQVTTEGSAPRRRRLPLLVTAGLLLLVAAAAAWLFLRPGASAGSSVHPAVTVECSAATGVDDDACRAWGDAILADDPAPRTFEREDLRRLHLDRSTFGFGDECTVAFFISRYPDSPVWSGVTACR